MTNIIRIALLGAAFAAFGFGQLNTILKTTVTTAITDSQTTFAVGSTTGMQVATGQAGGTKLYVVDIGQTMGEPMDVLTVVNSTTVTVGRTRGRAVNHTAGAMVLIATVSNWFQNKDPQGKIKGTCAQEYVTPWVNTETGRIWACSSKSLTYVAHWGNYAGTPQVLSATATDAVAGATPIAGPLVEVATTNAITSFTMSTGWNGQPFCLLPTAAFTGTATNNIAKAFTAVANRTLCFTWNSNLTTPAFDPSY